jgi:hypothetical protein
MRTLLTLTALIVLGIHANAQSTCATPIVVVPGTYTVAQVNGMQIPTPLCAPNGTTNTTAGMWYSYTPTTTTSVILTTNLPQNGGTDTRVHIYSGPCNNLVCVAGDDDGGGDLTSLVTWNAVAGTTYRIAFDNRWTSNGFDFLLNEGALPVGAISFVNVPVSTSGSSRAVVDMNGDNLDDVVSISSTNVRISYQQPGGTFSVVNIPTTQAVNTPSWSMSVGDIDGNGQMDLLYGGGDGVTFMYANEDGTAFTQVSGPEYVFSQRSNFVDINNDGHLDAFVCHDVQPNVYYLNDGEGNLSFNQGGLGDTPDGGNYGSIWIDYDSDGDIDMFIAKCRGGNSAANINQLHRNNGDGTFTEVGAQVGLADNVQTWSSAWGDFDNDGNNDVIVGASSFVNGGHKVMRNNGTTFDDVTAGTGWDQFFSTSIEHVAHDFDNNGYLDVLAGGGVIMLNNGDMTFSAASTGVSGGSVGDLNNDGFLDVLNDGTIRMNVPNENNWIKINTIGTQSNKNGIGARVTITSSMGPQMRDVKSGDGFRYMSSLTAHFGIGQDTEIEEVVVYWPSGLVSVIPSPEINTTINITESSVTTDITEEADEDQLHVYPNPTSDLLRVEGPQLNAQHMVRILDTNGRLVHESTLRNGSLDVSGLTNGSYVLQLTSEGSVLTRKFTKR